MPFSEKQVLFRMKMTVSNKVDESKHPSSGKFYVRLQNVPPSAGQKDVREFFSGLPIVSGGISFHGRGAFVVFYSREDALAAVQMSRKRLLLGMVMRVSNVERHEMRRSQLDSARRKLVMDYAIQQTVVPPIPADLLQRRPSKRIRPSTVSREVGKSAAKEFCPDEIESSEDAKAGQTLSRRMTDTATTRTVVRKQNNLKTIKPTPVLSLKQFNLVYEQEVF